MAEGEAALFLAAEIARDSLAAPALAVHQFQELAMRWPESLFAPKALLAAAALAPEAADSLATAVAVRYPGSPYVLVLAGRGARAYAQLEDSLLALTGVAAPLRGGVGRAPQRPLEVGPPSVPLPDEARPGRGGPSS